MKKTAGFFLFIFLLISLAVSAQAKTKDFDAKGEVVDVDPLYGRITVAHGVIPGFAGDGKTEFFVESADLLKGLGRFDLVEFSVRDDKDGIQITSLKKTGHKEPAKNNLQIGQAVQDVLVATGETAKFVTSPIPPAHEVVSGVVGVTTDATGSVVEKAEVPTAKKEF